MAGCPEVPGFSPTTCPTIPLPSSPPRTEVLSHSWREGSAEEDLKPLPSPRRPGREEGGERRPGRVAYISIRAQMLADELNIQPEVSPLPHCLNVVFKISQPLSSSPFPLSFISVFISTTKIPSNFFFSLSPSNAPLFQMLIISSCKRLRSGSRLFDLWPVICFHLSAFKCYFRFTLTY